MNTKILKIGTFAIIAILAFGCKHYEPAKMDFEPLNMSKVISIKDFIAEFGRDNNRLDDSDLFPIRPNSGNIGLYSVDTIRKGGADIIIAGRVISDDSQGNYYKAIAIQDLTDPKYALKISIDASGIGAWYPLGSIVSIRCNGLVIGKYADMFQLGTVYFNNNDNAAKKGYEPGRIPLPLFQVRAKVHSLPELDKIVVDTLTIAQINQLAAIKGTNGTNATVIHNDRQIHSRIVCIKDAYFTGQGVDFGLPSNLNEADKIFAPSTNGIGYPQSRVIRDATGWTVIATSEYSRFCNVRIPDPEYVGNITAIVGWYEDKDDKYVGSVQLTIRSLNDLELNSTDDGSKWKP